MASATCSVRAEIRFKSDTRTLIDVVKWADDRIALKLRARDETHSFDNDCVFAEEIRVMRELKELIADSGIKDRQNWIVTTPKENE